MRYLRPAVPLSLILAAPAAASSTAAAGPSATPLILELLLAAIVIAGLTVRRRMARALASLRRVRPAPRRASVRARGV
jgi:hypothetical protein